MGVYSVVLFLTKTYGTQAGRSSLVSKNRSPKFWSSSSPLDNLRTGKVHPMQFHWRHEHAPRDMQFDNNANPVLRNALDAHRKDVSVSVQDVQDGVQNFECV